jgi:hypothetical protein
MAKAKPDRKGYRVSKAAPPTGGHVFFRVTRTEDKIVVAEVRHEDEIDPAIAKDRKKPRKRSL